MSKYYPKPVIINNPQKNIADDIVEQFFTILKTGDIDQIRTFVNKNKIKYSVFESNTKNKLSDTGQNTSPCHFGIG